MKVKVNKKKWKKNIYIFLLFSKILFIGKKIDWVLSVLIVEFSRSWRRLQQWPCLTSSPCFNSARIAVEHEDGPEIARVSRRRWRNCKYLLLCLWTGAVQVFNVLMLSGICPVSGLPDSSTKTQSGISELYEWNGLKRNQRKTIRI